MPIWRERVRVCTPPTNLVLMWWYQRKKKRKFGRAYKNNLSLRKLHYNSAYKYIVQIGAISTESLQRLGHRNSHHWVMSTQIKLIIVHGFMLAGPRVAPLGRDSGGVWTAVAVSPLLPYPSPQSPPSKTPRRPTKACWIAKTAAARPSFSSQQSSFSKVVDDRDLSSLFRCKIQNSKTITSNENLTYIE